MSLSHSLGVLTHPEKEWTSIRDDRETTGKLYLSHVWLLALIPAVSAFYGTTEIGWTIDNDKLVRLTPASAAQLCSLFYLAILGGILFIGKAIDFFAVTYDVDETQHKGVSLAAYSATPLFIISLVIINPVLWLNLLIVAIGAAWSIYLLYSGLPVLMHIPKERGFMFASSVLTVGLVMLVGLLAISVIIWSAGFGPVYVS
jgi:hypothetical protein